jgi:anaerobic magnesium-protoporphyrin IX monomethyl ester cyclase
VVRLVQEIERVKSKYRMDFVKFGDDYFAMKADSWLEEFAEKYSKRIGIPFNCYLRLDLVTDDMLKLLKKAGCFSVHLGIDSTSMHIRNNVLKRRMNLGNEDK